MNDVRPATTMPKIDPQHLADVMARWLNAANDDPRLADRLASAQTVVHVHLNDATGVTVRLDHTPVEAEPRITGTAEVEIWGRPELFLQMVRREKHMAMLIADGELEYDGPVRKLLRIVPILRSLDFEIWREELGRNTPPSAPGADAPAA